MNNPAFTDADVAYQQEMLRELAEIGMDLARALRREVVEAPEGAKAVSCGDVALAFSRIARAVRLTLALEARGPGGTLAGAGAVAEAPPPYDPAMGITADQVPGIRLGAYKKVVTRVIGDAIAAEADGIEAERLTEALYERLYERDDDEDLIDLPIGALINRIRTDLGLPALAEPWTEEERAKFRPEIMAAKAAREAGAYAAMNGQRPSPASGAPWRAKRPAPA